MPQHALASVTLHRKSTSSSPFFMSHRSRSSPRTGTCCRKRIREPFKGHHSPSFSKKHATNVPFIPWWSRATECPPTPRQASLSFPTSAWPTPSTRTGACSHAHWSTRLPRTATLRQGGRYSYEVQTKRHLHHCSCLVCSCAHLDAKNLAIDYVCQGTSQQITKIRQNNQPVAHRGRSY